MLNPHAPIPLYRQLADLLTAEIRSGIYTAGSRIPSEHQLAAVHGIGRPTARQAVDILVRKGLLVRRRGSGTYVCEPQKEVDLFSLDGTSTSFLNQNLSVKTHILKPIALRSVRSTPHNPFNGAQAYFFSRLTIVNHEPVLIEDIFLHAQLFKGIEHIDLEGRSLSAVAEECFYLKPDSGKQHFNIGYSKDEKARYLKVTAQTPVLAVKRFLHFPGIQCGVFAELWCRTDRFVFSQTIGGATHG